MKPSLSLLVAVALGLCSQVASAEMATMPSNPPPQPAASTPQAAAPTAPPVEPSDDPLESVNRKVFWFNDQLDTYILVPVATAWDFVVPDPAQTSVSNFFANLRFPIDTVNNLLQGKVAYAATDVGRFAVNTTIGVAGFFDPAKSFGLEPHVEDFGQTLGWWGLSPGPYLVLPILGPSSVRDGGGLIVDYPLAVTPFFIEWYYSLAARTIEIVNFRASILDQVKQAKEASFDYYSFVRSAYLQRRFALVQDLAPMSKESETDLYHPEEN